MDPFLVNTDAVRNDDLDKTEPFRKYAHYWLPGDELIGGRAMGAVLKKISKHVPMNLIDQIREIYAAAETRQDVEDNVANKRRATP